MKDIIKEYQKQSLLKNTGIIVTSLALAFGVHTFVFDGEMSRYLKANVLEVNQSVQNADLYMVHNDSSLSLKNGKTMKQVSSLSFSLVYDATKIEVADFLSPLEGVSITTLTNEPGLATFILNFSENQDIPAGKEIFSLKTRKLSETTGFINLLNANFSDGEDGEFLLSTSWTMF